VLKLQLLDRIIHELDHNPGLAASISDEYLFSLLKSAVYQWRNHYQGLADKSAATIQPSQLARKLQVWCRQCDLQANTLVYTMILEACASNASDPKEGAVFADSLLDWMFQEAKQKHHFAVQPTTLSVGVVLKAWSESGRNEACEKIEEWIERMEILNEQGWPNLQPNTVVYNIWLHTLARSKQRNRAEKVLQTMLERQGSVAPDQMSFSSVLLAYTMENSLDAMVEVETLLDQMLELYFSGMDSAKPNKHSFATAMSGFARLGQPEAVERLRNKMEELYRDSKDLEWEPDIAIYNNVMLAWSKAGQPDQANAVLMEILESGTIVPNESSFHAVLMGWSKTGKPESAEELLHQMHEWYVAGAHDSPPTTQTYNIVLDSWAKSGRQDAWQRGRDILRHMEALYKAGEDGVKPNVITWNTALNCFRNCGKGDFHHAFKFLEDFLQAIDEGNIEGAPTSVTWNTLFTLCEKNASDDFRVNQIWGMMKSRGLKPSVGTYTHLYRCYAQYASEGTRALQQMEKYIHQMKQDEDVVPGRATYLALIDAYIAFGRLEKAERVLSEFCRAVPSSDLITADLEPFHRILSGWLRIGKPRRVESMVLLMEELSHRDGFGAIKPDVATYNILLQAWARSGERQAGERADLILREMTSRGVNADLKSHNIALNAWANSGDPIALTKIESLILGMILRGRPGFYRMKFPTTLG